MAATGRYTSEAIAKELNVSRRTVTTWKGDPEFREATRDARNAWRGKAQHEGIADQDDRLRHLQDLRTRLRAAILERAKANHERAFGAKTGLVCVTYKMQSLGEGQGSKAIAEYRIDTNSIDAYIALQEAAALEKGERRQKLEHVGAIDVHVLMKRINAGRQRAVEESLKRELALAAGAQPGA